MEGNGHAGEQEWVHVHLPTFLAHRLFWNRNYPFRVHSELPSSAFCSARAWHSLGHRVSGEPATAREQSGKASTSLDMGPWGATGYGGHSFCSSQLTMSLGLIGHSQKCPIFWHKDSGLLYSHISCQMKSHIYSKTFWMKQQCFIETGGPDIEEIEIALWVGNLSSSDRKSVDWILSCHIFLKI